MPIQAKSSQEFLEFISMQEGENKFQNLQLVLDLEKKCPGMFNKVMTNFEDAKSYRESLDKNGNPIKVSWEEALKKFYLSSIYRGVTEENIDIAQLFNKKGIPQEMFDKASNFREKAKSENIPEHILGKHLKEETILESIETIKKQTENELSNGQKIIEELYDKQFTYEWLSKNDPHNSIMGLFCGCCATITNAIEEQNIESSTIIAPYVQNLVIRNENGDIISKGTMYLNKQKNYAVINNFELNKRYRNHETSERGEYNVDENSKEEKERELVFEAFMRGIQAFVEEYDKQNPDNPLEQVNVGMGYNRLKKQVERFKKETFDLKVPYEYSFEDARMHQRILYERKNIKERENGGQYR